MFVPHPPHHTTSYPNQTRQWHIIHYHTTTTKGTPISAIKQQGVRDDCSQVSHNTLKVHLFSLSTFHYWTISKLQIEPRCHDIAKTTTTTTTLTMWIENTGRQGTTSTRKNCDNMNKVEEWHKWGGWTMWTRVRGGWKRRMRNNIGQQTAPTTPLHSNARQSLPQNPPIPWLNWRGMCQGAIGECCPPSKSTSLLQSTSQWCIPH